MLLALVTILALLAIGASCLLALKLRDLEARQRSLESASPQIAALPPIPAINPLEGLRMGLSIQQDHAHPVFANLLKESLLREDVTEVAMFAGEGNNDDFDIFIRGSLTCNGYAEIYYEAEFTATTCREAICTLIERPPHGDRPGNLAIELIDRLKIELQKLVDRNERRSALRELREE